MPVGLELDDCNPLLPFTPQLGSMLLRRCPAAVPLFSMLLVFSTAHCLLCCLSSTLLLLCLSTTHLKLLLFGTSLLLVLLRISLSLLGCTLDLGCLGEPATIRSARSPLTEVVGGVPSEHTAPLTRRDSRAVVGTPGNPSLLHLLALALARSRLSLLIASSLPRSRPLSSCTWPTAT